MAAGFDFDIFNLHSMTFILKESWQHDGYHFLCYHFRFLHLTFIRRESWQLTVTTMTMAM